MNDSQQNSHHSKKNSNLSCSIAPNLNRDPCGIPSFYDVPSNLIKHHIAFVCIDNSCRSQMAEGWLNYFSMAADKEHIQAYSGGILTQPIYSYTIEVMKEKGIDLSRHRSKSLFTIPLDRLTHIVTVCEQAREVCPPTIPGISYSHWSIFNPTKHQGTLEEKYTIFRMARDQIGNRVQAFVSTLL